MRASPAEVEEAVRQAPRTRNPGSGCNIVTGRFQVHFFELQPDNHTIKRALLTFEQHCEGGPLLLSGCIHIE
jgi:hypothetical protein